MLSPTQGRLATLVIGCVLLGAACGNENPDIDNPISPILMPDASAPRADAAIGTGNPAPVGGSDAGMPNTGVLNPRPDATTPTPTNDAAVDTGVVATPEGGTSDATAGGGDAGDGGVVAPVGDAGPGDCCPDGKCLCHGPAPTALTANKGPYKTASYTIAGTGCVFYPTDAQPPFAAVTVSDGFLGAGGCGSFQTGQWGPLYASWGIVAMIVDTGSSDQPDARGRALIKGIEAFKAENTKSGSPLSGKLAGRYGTSGFSMGGGGTSYASRTDKTLLSSVALMPWGPVTSGVSVPTLVVCGSSDGTAPCAQHGNGLYRGIANTVPKMRIQINSGHAGQPSSGGGKSGEYGLAFQKVFLEGDLRWRPLLVAAPSEETNIK
jgi:hypothetical protein